MGDLSHETSNSARADEANREVTKSFVERLFNLERDFQDAKAEHAESVKDLKTEIKGRADETGVVVKTVVELVKIRLNEQEARDALVENEANLMLYESLFGFSEQPSAIEAADDEEDDPLA